MAHNPSLVLMGSTRSSFREAGNIAGEIAAGLAVRRKSDESGSILEADGALVGISLGRSLSKIPYSSYVKEGSEVPVHLTDGFTPTIGAQVHISDTTGRAAAAGGGATGTNAIYRSGVLTGRQEDGSNIRVALIDFEGGL